MCYYIFDLHINCSVPWSWLTITITNKCSQYVTIHYKNKIGKITNLLVGTVARNSGNCNLICRVGCYGYTCNYNPIIVISIFLSCLIE